MTFPPQGSSGQQSSSQQSSGQQSSSDEARLPDPGWLPDPARIDLERYWNGWNWTDLTRDRVNLGAYYPVGASAAITPSRPRLIRPWISMLAIMAAVAVGVGSLTGLLPPRGPSAPDPAPDTLDVAKPNYPVFGSDATVTYLATGLVAQRESIDVTLLAVEGQDVADEVGDAMQEALAQNPYAFVYGWRIRARAGRVQVFPDYLYSSEEAERRRVATAAAVKAILADPTVKGATDDRATVGALHDAVVRLATYDHGAYEAIRSGDTSDTSSVVAQSQEAYGVLVDGTAVCSGYAQAFQLLATAAGLTSVVVTGPATSGVTTGDHAWNRVLIDGEWLVVDTTWDDAQDTLPRRDYLLMDPSDMRLLTRTADDYWVVDANRGLYE